MTKPILIVKNCNNIYSLIDYIYSHMLSIIGNYEITYTNNILSENLRKYEKVYYYSYKNSTVQNKNIRQKSITIENIERIIFDNSNIFQSMVNFRKYINIVDIILDENIKIPNSVSIVFNHKKGNNIYIHNINHPMKTIKYIIEHSKNLVGRSPELLRIFLCFKHFHDPFTYSNLLGRIEKQEDIYILPASIIDITKYNKIINEVKI